MNWDEANAALDEGKHVRRSTWGEGWKIGKDASGTIWSLNPHTGDERVFTLYETETTATNWRIVP